MPQQQPSKPKDFKRRFLVVSIGAPIVLTLLHNPNTAMILIQITHVLCSMEWIRLIPSSSEKKNDGSIALRIFPLASLLITKIQYPSFIISILSSSYYLLTPISHHCIFGFLYLSMGFRCLVQISGKSFYHSLVFILTVWNCDTGALVFGRLASALKWNVWEKRLVPRVWKEGLGRISPNKSVIGIVGGLIFGTMTAITVPILIQYIHNNLSSPPSNPPLQYPNILLNHIWLRRAFVGFLTSITAILGDLVESSIKRNAGAKDSGQLLPGHGGLLDRMDSCLIASGLYHYYFLSEGDIV